MKLSVIIIKIIFFIFFFLLDNFLEILNGIINLLSIFSGNSFLFSVLNEFYGSLFRCSLIERYIAVTRHSIYTIEYNRLKSSNSNSIIVTKVLDIEQFHSARIACNENNIFLYTTEQQSSSIQIYDRQFNQMKIFQSSIINSPSFCCTNTLIALTEKENVLVSYVPYITPKKISLLLFDIETFQLRYTIDLNNCSNIYTMKCLEQYNVFFALSDEKILWIIKIDQHEMIQIAQKPFYTNQTEV